VTFPNTTYVHNEDALAITGAVDRNDRPCGGNEEIIYPVYTQCDIVRQSPNW